MVRRLMGFGLLTVPSKAMKKLWIDLEGIAIPVPESHEEYANSIGHELEALLDKGWVRVQSVPPLYLLIDFQLRLNALQAATVRGLLQNRFEQIVVEFACHVKNQRRPTSGKLGVRRSRNKSPRHTKTVGDVPGRRHTAETVRRTHVRR
jgi:hypothetical protein